MSNSWFAFKQFRVHQDRCAMKVSTDACIQGAWTPIPDGANHVLDAGAGTGLLSLMIAQRASSVHIDAVELNEAAAMQLRENVTSSPFAGRIRAMNGDVSEWSPLYKYDLIICNPPFFKNSLPGPDSARNLARHSGNLNAGTLSRISASLLSVRGRISAMWPVAEHEVFLKAAQAEGLHLNSCLKVRDRPESRITRIISTYGRELVSPAVHELTIKQTDGSYSPEFSLLLSAFYLRL